MDQPEDALRPPGGQGLFALGATDIFHLQTAVLNRTGVPLQNQRNI